MRIAEPAWAILFLLTPLREGRLRRHDGLHRAGMHFYSRPCGRGDFAASISLRSCIISTHAPAGGATGCKPYSFPNWKISTHAPAGGATSQVVCVEDGTYYFYSRPCGRGDAARCAPRWDRPISTHAPAGGATKIRIVCVRVVLRISTHAPAGGATATVSELNNHKNISTHAPAGGATMAQKKRRRKKLISTHAPAGGATGGTGDYCSALTIFLLTPLREGRLFPRHNRITVLELFLLTPLREGRQQFSTSPS